MVIIRCETGDDVQVETDSLAGSKLTGLNLHRALLDGQDLRGVDLSDSELRSAWVEGTEFRRCHSPKNSFCSSQRFQGDVCRSRPW